MATQATGQAGFSLLEAVVAMALLAVLLGLAAPRYAGYLADRSLQNAAHLLQADLRLAQQAAISRAGSGPRVEMCLRAGGYDAYAVNYQDPIARTGAQLGTMLKAANAGQEYRAGITMRVEPAPGVACTDPFSGVPVVFSGSGTPMLGANPAPQQTVVLEWRGRAYRVTIVPRTGRVTVTR